MTPPAAVLVPARDEEETLPHLLEVLAGITGRTDAEGVALAEVLVVDNGSRDGTARTAREGGARVVAEPVPGYGRACRRGLAELSGRHDPETPVVILDADDPWAAAQVDRLLEPLRRDRAELVTAARGSAAGSGTRRAPSPVPAHAALGNRIVSAALSGVYGASLTDMGPFRAARLGWLRELGLDDPAFGWNVQMTVRTLRMGGRVLEVGVAFRERRRGRSKISGSLTGSVAAGRGMLAALFREVVSP